MTKAYLWFNSVLYIALGIWCTVSPEGTANSIGYVLSNGSAHCEYLTVYGGLEIGLGVFFAICAIRRDLYFAGLVFGAASYGGIAVWRIVSVATNADPGLFPKAMLPFEVTLAALAFFLLKRRQAVLTLAT